MDFGIAFSPDSYGHPALDTSTIVYGTKSCWGRKTSTFPGSIMAQEMTRNCGGNHQHAIHPAKKKKSSSGQSHLSSDG